jgi:pimeloyl-ACP methyl ester carboxylesterase
MWDEKTARAFIGRDRDLTPAGPPGGPSLVVLAEGSPYVPAPAVEGLRSTGWVVETIPGTGHHVHIDDRPAFMSSILGWVAEPHRAASG